MDDQELLRQYVDRQSERAFTDLVTRHIDLVYSTALRIVQDPGLAKDVTQSVFIRLAQKAPTIRSGHALPGWLYRVAHGQAANAVRAERTRHKHETEAMTMKSHEEEDRSVMWKSILPHLDEALSRLKTTEQNAIVLRFFEGRSWREVGAALSLNEDTAQKRVDRALDKLRLHFRRRGIVLSAVAIAAVISANAAQAAPVGLASTVAAASLTCAAGAGSFSLSATYIHSFIMKKTASVLLLVALASVVVIPIIVFQARKQPASAASAEASIRRGLVLDYKFDRGVVGGRIIDGSGAGNDGQIIGAQRMSDPQRGGVLQFSPPNQYILVPNSASLNPSNLTLAVWIKTSDQGDTWRRVFDKGWTDGFALSIAGGHTPSNTFQGKAVIEIAKKYSARSGQTVTDGQWHHMAVTYNGAKEVLYIDGVAQKRIENWVGRVPVNSHDLTIGINLIDPNAQYNEVGASFDGLMDEPMMFNRGLLPDEIKSLFNSQRK